MSNINAKSVVKYVVLPGIIPRTHALFTSGFSWIAYLIATLYAMVKLLPENHPYLQPHNRGQYNIRHVIGAAANNLVISKHNWDQILIFATIITGIVILAVQIILLIAALLFQPALAQTFNGSIFATPAPAGGGSSTDIAFLLLDRVFGIPGFFCAAGNVCTDVLNGSPWPIHAGLHSMLKFYSMGLLIVAVLIVLYYVIVITAETATSGTPFGERFKNVWVPVRLVVALGLLTPINYGLNSAQYITLYAAKIGSGFATNGWHRFNRGIGDKLGDQANPLGETKTLLALPNTPDITSTIQFMSLVHACAYAEWKTDLTIENNKLKYGEDSIPPDKNFYIQPYLVKNPLIGTDTKQKAANTEYESALAFYNKGPIIIVFGRDVSTLKDKQGNFIKKGIYPGDIEPTCGSIKINIADTSTDNIDSNGGAASVQKFYYNLIKQIWVGGRPKGSPVGVAGDEKILIDLSHRYAELHIKDTKDRSCEVGARPPIISSASNCKTEFPGAMAMSQAKRFYQGTLNSAVKDAWEKYRTGGLDVAMKKELYDRGWGGAGIWYNTISQVNGSFTDAVLGKPVGVKMPLIMEEVSEKKRERDKNIHGREQYNPITSNGDNVAETLQIDQGEKKAAALYDLLKGWETGGVIASKEDKLPTKNMLIDTMHLILGTHGLFAMRGENATIHPMAQLSTLGKGIVNSAVLSIAGSSVLSLFSGASYGIGATATVASKFLNAIAFIGITAGVILFYILPLLPFMYFFFAVGNWVKGLFEAMVGVPLWALAHIRLDGEGLPGDAASDGYFLIFEIMVRPILIVFGLVAATVIFSAQVRILNFIWDLVVDNVGGFDDKNIAFLAGTIDLNRDIVDQFFFTLLYTIIVYLMAQASFKLIDSIPNDIMRFSGAGVKTFSDGQKNIAQDIENYAARGGLVQGQQLTKAIQDASQGTGKAIGDTFKRMKKGKGNTPGAGGKNDPNQVEKDALKEQQDKLDKQKKELEEQKKQLDEQQKKLDEEKNKGGE